MHLDNGNVGFQCFQPFLAIHTHSYSATAYLISDCIISTLINIYTIIRFREGEIQLIIIQLYLYNFFYIS